MVVFHTFTTSIRLFFALRFTCKIAKQPFSNDFLRYYLRQWYISDFALQFHVVSPFVRGQRANFMRRVGGPCAIEMCFGFVYRYLKRGSMENSTDSWSRTMLNCEIIHQPINLAASTNYVTLEGGEGVGSCVTTHTTF